MEFLPDLNGICKFQDHATPTLEPALAAGKDASEKCQNQRWLQEKTFAYISNKKT